MRNPVIISAVFFVLICNTQEICVAQEPDARSVLFIGNSMIGRTMYHLSKATEQEGHRWRIIPATRGGARLESFWDDEKTDVFGKIDSGKFTDVVFVQGTAYWFEGPPKDSLNRETDDEQRVETAEKTIVAAQEIHEHAARAGARTVIYLSYPHMRKEEQTPRDFDLLESVHWRMKDRLDAMEIAGKTHPSIFVPVGRLWLRGVGKYGENVWYKDDRHGSDLAYFANAMLFYACLSGGDPRELNYDGGCEPEQATWVKEQAWDLLTNYARP